MGKGTIKDYLLDMAAGAGLRAVALSFSDQIKLEGASRGMDPGSLDRHAITRVAREMRKA